MKLSKSISKLENGDETVIELFGDSKYSYYKSYRSMKDLENAVKRPQVINYTIINKPEE